MPLQTLSTEKTTVNSPQTPLKERVPSQNCIQGCSFLHLQVSGKCMFLRRGTINNAPTYVHRATCQLPVNNCQRRSPMWRSSHAPVGFHCAGHEKKKSSVKCSQQPWWVSTSIEISNISLTALASFSRDIDAYFVSFATTLFGPWKQQEAMFLNSFSQTLVRFVLITGSTKWD